MFEFLLMLLEALTQFMAGIVGNGAVNEDGSPVIAPCTSGLDSAYLLMRYARHMLVAEASGAAGTVPALWDLLSTYCSE